MSSVSLLCSVQSESVESGDNLHSVFTFDHLSGRVGTRLYPIAGVVNVPEYLWCWNPRGSTLDGLDVLIYSVSEVNIYGVVRVGLHVRSGYVDDALLSREYSDGGPHGDGLRVGTVVRHVTNPLPGVVGVRPVDGQPAGVLVHPVLEAAGVILGVRVLGRRRPVLVNISLVLTRLPVIVDTRGAAHDVGVLAVRLGIQQGDATSQSFT